MSDPLRYESESAEAIPTDLRDIARLLDQLGAEERAGAGERLAECAASTSVETLVASRQLARELADLGKRERAAAPAGFEAAVFAASCGALTGAPRAGTWRGMVAVRRMLALAAAVAVVGAGMAVYFALEGSGPDTGARSATTIVLDPPGGESRDSGELALLVDEEMNDLLAVLESAASPSPQIGRFKAELESAVSRLDRPAGLGGWELNEGSAL